MSLKIGAPAPGCHLPDTEGNEHSPPQGTPLVVAFTCNHCPYALAWHDRLLAVARDYADRDVTTLLICSNDAERYPQDGPAAMRERVEQEGPWPAPYLFDASQQVARNYGAEVTPDVFVFDAGGMLRWRGAPDEDHKDPSLDAAWLREALDAVLAGEEVEEPHRPPVGCTIKWK